MTNGGLMRPRCLWRATAWTALAGAFSPVVPNPARAQQAAPPAPAVPSDPVADPVAMLKAGNAAYLSGQWQQAAEAFQAFLDRFKIEPTAADAVAQVKPLLALARIRLGEYGAAGELVTESLALPKLDPKLRDELSFWKGIILLQVQAYEESRNAFLAYFQTPEFQAQRRVESILMYGTTFVLEGEHAKAAAFFEQQSTRLWSLDQEAALRGQTLRLHCLMELGDTAKARELVRSIQPHLGEVTQIVSLQGLTAELGGRLLEAGDPYGAIFCLQRVWNSERLLRHQTEKIEKLKQQIESLSARPGTEPQVFQKRSVLTRIEREQRTFAAQKDFDLAVRMRLGFAYLGLERWREAALVLEDALNLPGDPKQQAQAGLAVIQCWHELKRYDRAVAAADSWLARFEGKVDEDSAARARFLLGQAHHEAGNYAEAAQEFESLAKGLPKHDLAPQALFMAGMARLMGDENEAASALFSEITRRFDKLPLAEDADYWLGMAMSFAQDYAKCRDHLAQHLKHYSKSARYEAPAVFRRAYCQFALGSYEDAIEEFHAYLERYPQGADTGEARVLLGDTLASLGRIDEAMDAYRQVAAEDTKWFEDAQFKIGNVLKLRRDYVAMKDHFERFVKEHGSSKRLPDAVYWLGFACQSLNQPEEAKAMYWDTVRTHGDLPRHYGVEDILLALPKLYRGADERLELLREIQRLRSEAAKANEHVLVSRLHWMEGHMQPADKPDLARAGFIMATEDLNVEAQNPRLIADCADASREGGSKAKARELYLDLIKWHPRAVEMERALAGLGFLAAEAGDWQEAVQWFDRFEKKALSMNLIPVVALKKAELLAAHGRVNDATAIYNRLLEDKLTPPRSKAESLMAWGRLTESQGDALKATAYYERVYLSYGRQHDLTAQAYLARGAALEKLGRKADASEVYTEFTSMDVLKQQPEFQEAALRLQRLGPPPPKPEPATRGVHPQ